MLCVRKPVGDSARDLLGRELTIVAGSQTGLCIGRKFRLDADDIYAMACSA